MHIETISQQASQDFSPKAQQISGALRQLQTELCEALEGYESKPFENDTWQRKEGGGGLSRVVEKGSVFEKGGVLFSAVCGQSLPPVTKQGADKNVQIPTNTPFFATGISLILHPNNPYVPTVHFNVRYLEVGHVHWFGGGLDLTPYYPFAKDCIHFHQTLKACCDRFDPHYYPHYKRWCDRYFFLKHRNEARGIGGIFFNHLSIGKEEGLAFILALGNTFLDAYIPLIQRHQTRGFNARERNFQQIRRGRYVEFNLLYDQGTLFGLQSQGRIESILVSMPPTVNWAYNWHPFPDSPEEALYTHFLPPIDWAGKEGEQKLAMLTAQGAFVS